MKPHAVRLEVPTDGSVPRVQEWQSLRRVSVAHADEHGPAGDEPVVTEYGLALPTQQHAANAPPSPIDIGDNPDDEESYEIDRVVSAERIGNRYKIWIKWVGYPELTWRWRHELVQETLNDELLSEIENAVIIARQRHQAQYGHADDECGQDDTGGVAPDITDSNTTKPLADTAGDLPDDRPLAQRRPRRGSTLAAVLPEQFASETDALSQLAYQRLQTMRSASDDYSFAAHHMA